MRLTELLDAGTSAANGGRDASGVIITGLTSDSRTVEPGFLFAALPGARLAGSQFIADAVACGAAAVLVPPQGAPPVPLLGPSGRPVPVIVDANPRRCLALMAARFFGRQPQCIAAVTGTNGKTSVVWFLRQIWQALGHPAAALGTLGLTTPAATEPGSLTTPDPVALHGTLARLAADGIEHVALEASSHGLDQHRLDGVRIAAAAFTTLGRDHLDYHASEDAYLAAKLRLFCECVTPGGAAVINADSTHAARVIAAAAPRLTVVSCGRAGRTLRLAARADSEAGQAITVVVDGAAHALALPLIGDFQAMNALCAAGLAFATGAAPEAALAALETLRPVPGRLERVGAARYGAAPVFVDYAHTPDALAAALSALRPHARGRLIVVFGCGGDRDAGKRPQMGAVAARLADRVFVTDDNPRSERPDAIRGQILVACPDASEIADRAEAITVAVRALAAGDVLLIAGKGHETGQIAGDRVLPFDDRLVAAAALSEVAA
ncbi:MAG: UDP-N-acetylmuramoyl-L-alanyl-D-glutamate--2,6-diaminopimelate ligase [Defluviicoccus sp.]